MKKLIFTIGCLTSAFLSDSQTLAWAERLGGSSYDEGRSVAVDASGNVYTAGTFQGTVDFNPGTPTYTLTAAGTYGTFITKFNSAGSFIWAKSMGGGQYAQTPKIVLDHMGHIYTTATNTLTGYGNLDICVSKLDTSGSIRWQKRMGGQYDDEGLALAVDAAGSAYTTGYYTGTADFNPAAASYTLTSNGTGSHGIFISKLDSTGSFVWAKSMVSVSNDEGLAIAVDAQMNVYTAGFFENTIDFDPGAATYTLTANGSYDVYVSKLNAAGNFKWAAKMGGTSGDQANAIAVDANGNVFTTGSFAETADFDPGATSSHTITASGFYSGDVFISKLDSTGAFLWVKQMGGTSSDDATSVVLDVAGNIYTSGSYIGTADFNPGPSSYALTSNGSQDVFISKLDASGNFLAAESVGSSAGDYGNDMTVDASGNIYMTGSFQSTADFDPTAAGTYTLSGSYVDAFVCKLGPATATGIESFAGQADVISIYPNPNSGTFTVDLRAASQLSISDSFGRIILDEKREAGKQLITLGDAANGIYFVKVSSSTGLHTGKIIKE